MLNIKKYADGRFFDSVGKKFIKKEQMEELIAKGEEFKVTLTKTGKDITDAVIAEFSRRTGVDKGDFSFLNTDSLKKWVGETIDRQIVKVLDAVNLPSKDQVAKLDANIRKLNRKIEAFEQMQAQGGVKKKTSGAGRKTAGKKGAPDPETGKPSASGKDTNDTP